MNYKNHLFLLPLVFLVNLPANASRSVGQPCNPGSTVYDTSGYYILTGAYSGRRTDTVTQRKIHRKDKPRTTISEFSAFETDNKTMPVPATRKHRYGGRRPDRHRMRH